MGKCRYGCIKGKVFLEALGNFVSCPDHGDSIERILEKNEEGRTSLYERLHIPQDFEDASVCDRGLFYIPGLGRFTPSSINYVVNLLEQINKDVYSGSVTKMSVYIHIPNIVDIRQFVYGLQKMAVEKGLDVTPYISAREIYELQRVGDYSATFLEEATRNRKDMNPDVLNVLGGHKYVLRTGLTYRDFVNSDLCFVKATAGTSRSGWYGLADLLDRRSARGLPTYVIGYWATKNFSVTGGPKFLLAPKSHKRRLDLMIPYELKVKSGLEDVE